MFLISYWRARLFLLAAKNPSLYIVPATMPALRAYINFESQAI